MKKLSVVIPVYYNENNLPPLYETLQTELFRKTTLEYELIFVDDGSGDNSYSVLQALQKSDEKIKLVKLSRNFGSHVAVLAGLSHCTGDCATVISADLQDPPEMILEMIEKWNEGNKVVLAVREDREEPLMQKAFSNTYYKLMQKFALPNMPNGGFDCFLIDRAVIDILKNIEEKNTTLMGQIIWCGFKTEKIYYTRRERKIGKSRWTLAKKIKLFMDSFISFSYAPIRIMSALGVLISFASFVFGGVILIEKVFYGISVEGWSSLMLVVLFVSGMQMIMLGLLGEYLWRAFDASRDRPTFIIDEKVGF